LAAYVSQVEWWMRLGVTECFVCCRVPLLSVFLHLGAVMFYDFNHPSEYKKESLWLWKKCITCMWFTTVSYRLMIMPYYWA